MAPDWLSGDPGSTPCSAASLLAGRGMTLKSSAAQSWDPDTQDRPPQSRLRGAVRGAARGLCFPTGRVWAAARHILPLIRRFETAN